MSGYLAVDLALYERLVGFPLDSMGRPKTDERGVPVNRLIHAHPMMPVDFAERPGHKLPSYGIRVPMLQPGKDKFNTPDTFNQKPYRPYKDWKYKETKPVPVYHFGLEGVKWPEVWPCVTFAMTDEEFNPSTFIYSDPYIGPSDKSPTVSVQSLHGQTFSGPDHKTFSPVADEYDLTYSIRIWSKTMTELRHISACLKEIFPARCGLDVEQPDRRDILTYDMELINIVQVNEGGRFGSVDRSLSESSEALYSTVFQYKIEGYDVSPLNLLEWEERTIQCRLFELANIQATLLETFTYEGT